MPKVIQYALYALGALAVLVVVNWARHEVVVGIVVACLLIVAVTVPSLIKTDRADEEGDSPS